MLSLFITGSDNIIGSFLSGNIFPILQRGRLKVLPLFGGMCDGMTIFIKHTHGYAVFAGIVLGIFEDFSNIHFLIREFILGYR